MKKKESILEYVQDISLQLRNLGLTEQERLLIFFRGLRNEILEYSIFKDPANFEDIITTARKMEHALLRWKIINSQQDPVHTQQIVDQYIKDEINIDTLVIRDTKELIATEKTNETVTQNPYESKEFRDMVSSVESELMLFEKTLDSITIEIQNFRSREPGDDLAWDNFCSPYDDINGCSKRKAKEEEDVSVDDNVSIYDNSSCHDINISVNLNSRYIDSEVRRLQPDTAEKRKEQVLEEIRRWFEKPEHEINQMLRGEDLPFRQTGDNEKQGNCAPRHKKVRNQQLLRHRKDGKSGNLGRRRFNEFSVRVKRVVLTKLHTFTHLLTNLKNRAHYQRPDTLCIVISPPDTLTHKATITGELQTIEAAEKLYKTETMFTRGETYKDLEIQTEEEGGKRRQ